MENEKMILTYVLHYLEEFGRSDNGLDILCTQLATVLTVINGIASYDGDKVIRLVFGHEGAADA